MKHIITCITLLFILWSIPLAAGALKDATTPSTEYGPQEKRFGVGIIAGDPTGLSAKGYVTPSFAVKGIASWSFVDEAATFIGDVTYDFFDIAVGTDVITVPFYAGVGTKLAIHAGKDDKTISVLRVPVGLAFQWTTYPVEIFLELAPGIEIVPKTSFDMTGGLGAHFYF